MRKLEDFDPLSVPTVQGLADEIDSFSNIKNEDHEGGVAGEEKGKNLQDWEKTSLKPYVDYFRNFVVALMRDEKEPKVKREREEGESMEF